MHLEIATPAPAVRVKPRSLRRRDMGWLYWIGALVVALVATYGFVRSKKAPPIAVRVHVVHPGSVRDLVTSSTAGRVSAAREVTLRAEIAGTVKSLLHRRGDKVEAGEPLVIYDVQDLKDRVTAAQASLALARAQLGQADANLDLSSRTVERSRKLHATGSSTQAELENLEGQARVAASGADAGRASLRQAFANLNLAKVALSKTVLPAPFRGTILTTSVEQGEMTSPGGAVVAMADVSRMYVEAELDEADLGRVALGMPAEVSLDAFPNQHLAGKLSEIAPSVTRDTRGSRSIAFQVEIAPDPKLYVGMTANVDLTVATRDNVLWVPANAVVGRGTDRSVYVVENGIARKRRIDVGISTWEGVEVKGGLSAGDEVIVTLSSADLADGVRVTATKEDAPKGAS